MGCLNDDSILGPVIHGCRGDFDFTIGFQNIFFSIVPAGIFLVGCPYRFLVLRHCRPIVLGQAFRLTKLVASVSYSALCLALLVAEQTSPIPGGSERIHSSLVAHSSGLAAAVFLALLSWVEHSKSARPSILIVIYLSITLLLDAARTRTAWLRSISEQPTNARILTTMVALKAVMIILESRSKTRWLQWDLAQHSPEETSGILSLGIFYWLRKLFTDGYRVVLSLESLYPLDKTLTADAVGKRLTKRLENSSWKGRRWGLVRLLLRTLDDQLFPAVIPRLVLLAASMCQPLLIQALLQFLQDENRQASHGYGLIGAIALTYGTIALSTALYWYFQERFVIMVRGCLVLAIYEKTTRLDLAATTETGVITLMGTDVERVLRGIHEMHEYWASFIQVVLSCWLLRRQLGNAFVVPLVVVSLSAVATVCLGNFLGPRQRAWMEAIEKRVGVTATAISQMKLMKMSGITEPIKTRVQNLRLEELKIGGKWRMLLVVAVILSQTPMLVSPVITFAVTAESLDTTKIFVSLSYITLLASPLMVLFQKIPQLLAAFTCLHRIQAFLENGSRIDPRNSVEKIVHDKSQTSDSTIELNAIRGQELPPVSIRGGSFGWREHTKVLRDVNVDIPGGCLTVVVGPVASGKTTLCKAILGEVPFSSGFVTVTDHRKIGYCDQQPFMTNASIRDNVVGHERFDSKNYHDVIHATMLDQDLAILPQGDSTLIGSGGIALSGGQRQRVSIARALYLSGADLLMFDDVLSGLDPTTEYHVFQRVFGPSGMLRRRHATVILCTHKTQHLEFSDHIISISDTGSVTQEIPADSKTRTYESDDFLKSTSSTGILAPTTTTAGNAQARQLGDKTIYAYYMNSIGIPTVCAFFFAGACCGFLENFPTVWLSFWSTDAAGTQRGSQQLHSQAYYIGIYGLLQAVYLVTLVVSCVLGLGTIIRSSGAALHQRALEAVVNAPLKLFTTTDTGTITNLFSQDMTIIDSELPMAVINVVLGIFSVFAMACVVASSAPWLSLTYPAMLAILWVIQHFYLRTSRQIRLLDLEAKSPLYTHFLDTLKGITTIRAFGWEAASIRQSSILLDQSQKPAYLLAMIQKWLILILSLVVAVIATALVTFMTQLGASSSLSGASLVTLMTLSEALAGIVRFYADLETSLGAVARLRNLVTSTETEKGGDSQPESSWPSTGNIEISGVWASYNKDSGKDFALCGIDVSIRPGEKIALCGRTGSGKSSLILLLLGLLEPLSHGEEKGTVLIDKVAVSSVELVTLRKRLITVPQDPVFLPAGSTIAENLDPAGIATPQQCREVLVDMGLWNMVEAQGGLDSGLAESSLSQGQRQIFSLARAVLKRRTGGGAVLLLDEFTSSVDVHTEQRMLAILEKEFFGCTIVMVTHRLDIVAEFCNRVLVIDKGTVVEDGDPKILRRMEGTWFATLLEATTT